MNQTATLPRSSKYTVCICAGYTAPAVGMLVTEIALVFACNSLFPQIPGNIKAIRGEKMVPAVIKVLFSICAIPKMILKNKKFAVHRKGKLQKRIQSGGGM